MSEIENRPAADLAAVERERSFDAFCESAELELAKAGSLDRVKAIRDQAEALQRLARHARLGRRRQNRVGAIRVRAERASGGLIAASDIGPGRPSKTSHDGTLLADYGITRNQSWRWQLIARIPETEFEEYLASRLGDDEDGLAEITQGDLLQMAKRIVRDADQRERARRQAQTAPEQAVVELASYVDWLPAQPDCDLLLTDPPYATDVEDVEAFARAWLPMALGKVLPTGRAYVFIGSYPDELRAYLDVATPEHLILDDVMGWTYRNTIGPQPTHSYKRNWQAILYYRGVDAAALDCPLMVEQFNMQEVAAPTGPTTGRWHSWQKPDVLAERFVRHATAPGDLVLDPFTCTGTFILAAARLGRKALGCEIDPDNLAIAVERGCQHVS